MIISKFVDVYSKMFDLMKSGKEVIIYGAGLNGLRAKGYVEQHSVLVKAFCDSSVKKQGSFCDGLQVYSPEEAISSGYPLIVASAWNREIINDLQSRGFVNFFDFSLIARAKRKMTSNLSNELSWLEGRFSDQNSKNVLSSLFEHLMNGSRTEASAFVQYHHPELMLQNGFSMIDAGAWQGDTVVSFASCFNGQNKILSLEPDPLNYDILRRKIDEINMGDNVKAHPLALWSEDKTLQFRSSKTAKSTSCSVLECGDTEVQAVTLDSLCRNLDFVPDFIKMDIEGAEVDALIGSFEVIKNHKPRLAICVYHDFDDLWHIPRVIDSIRSDYRMYLGHHSSNWSDTVLYCV